MEFAKLLTYKEPGHVRTGRDAHWPQLAAHDAQWDSLNLLATNNQQVVYLGSADLRASLVYACEAFIGTGGVFPWNIDADPIFEKPSTGAAIRFHITTEGTVARAEAAQANVRSVSDQLAAVKAAFGLSVSQLAEVLQVKRPTVYSWLDDEKGPNALRGANRERLSILCRFADEWNRQSKTPPGSLLTAAVVGEASLLDLLSAAKLNDAAIRKALEALCERLRTREDGKPSVGDRARAKGFAEVPRLRR